MSSNRSSNDYRELDVPDQTGKTFLVTGANTGIGFDAARVLANQNARVLLGCRSEEKAQLAIGRIQAGKISSGQPLVIMQEDGQTEGKVGQLFVFDKLGRTEAESAQAGDIAAVTGLEKIEIGDTLCDLSKPVALPRLRVDEPTLRMIFQINSSPLAGREGKFLTTRHLRDRLMRELEKNVALH